MNSTTAGWLVLLAAGLVAVVQMGYYWPQLPPEVASEFDFQGRASGWMSKTGLVLVHTGTMLAMAAFPVVFRWLVRVLPLWAIDMPHKEYWLAPERRRQTARLVSPYLAWLFAATALLVTGIFQFTYLANLGLPQAMRRPPLALLGMYGVFMLVWIVAFYRRFRLPKQGSR
jgi:hypothetical protein